MGDEPLLFQLYAGTREQELAQTGWDARTRAQFLQGQFQAQRVGYRSAFPNGNFSIVLLDKEPIGRIVLAETEDEVRLVDIVLTPTARGRGLGSALLLAVQVGASRLAKPVRLHVIRQSPAVRWYLRFGFTKIAEQGYHDKMEWHPPVAKE